jgi:16S rRNA (guanine527-N7)-methyltransferase
VSEIERAEKRLAEGLEVIGARKEAPARIVTEGFRKSLMDLMRMTLEGNETVNLTAIIEPMEFVELHLLDSLACVGFAGISKGQRVVDVGTGAGFPGIPLALAYPDKQFLLVDSLAKRTAFVERAANALGADNITAVQIRAEALGRKTGFREGFDLALSRATGPFSAVLEYTLPLLRVGGELYAYKTVAKESEIEETLLARELLGGSKNVEKHTYRDILPDRGHAVFVVLKERATPKSYPRKPGIPTKVPL